MWLNFCRTDIVTISNNEGALGSIFQVGTAAFPPNETVNVLVNNVNLGQTQSNDGGELYLLLDTSGANSGFYRVVLTNSAVTTATQSTITVQTTFRIKADALLHLADGSGEPLDVPPGIGVNEVFLPAISR